MLGWPPLCSLAGALVVGMPDKKQNRLGKKRVALRVLYGAFLVHAAGATLVLNTPLLPNLVNTWQDGFLQYKAAVSLLPGIVHVYGFELRHQDRNVQWTTRIDQVSAGINLASLFKHKLDIYFVRASHLDVRFGFRPKGKPSPLHPEFAGLPPKEPKKPKAPGEPESPKWGIAINDIKLRHLDHVWFSEIQLKGVTHIDGSFAIVPDERVTVGPARWWMERGQLEHGENGVLKNLTMSHDVKLNDFHPDQLDLDKMWFLDSHSVIDADVASHEFLNFLFRNVKWISANKGTGKLHVDATVDDGQIVAGTKASITNGKVDFDFLGHELTGGAEVQAEVLALPNGEPEAKVSVRVNDFAITDPGTKVRHLTGELVEVLARSTALSLDSPLSRLAVGLNVVRARVNQLTYFNKYVPESMNLKIKAGTGRLDAHIESEGEGKAGHRTDFGWLKLVTDGAVARYGELDLKGKVQLNAKLRRGVLAEKRFDIANTSVSITDVAVESDQPLENEEFASKSWWGEVSIPSGEFYLGTPLEVDGTVAATLKDTRPLLAIYSVKNDIPGILRGILDPGLLRATGRLKLDGKLMEMSDLRVQSDGLELLGRLRFQAENKRAVLLARYGMISVGIGRQGEDTRIVINKAEDWYKKSSKFAPLP